LARAVKRCLSCGEGFASADLLQLYRLEFLLEETATWRGMEGRRAPYEQALELLRARLLRETPEAEAPRTPALEPAVAEAPPAPAPEPAVAEAAVAPVPEPAPARVEAIPAAEPPVAEAEPIPPAPPAPPKEKVPFDQWLLSERNIKIALYSGAAMLVVAGLIFVGVSWGRMPGPAKFAITVMVTGLMYLGGYLLFRRPSFGIGGIALLGVASGFVIVNFAILQLYVLGPAGLRDDVMWLIASPLCLVLYLLTAYWTKGDLFTYISLAAVVSAVTAALVVADAPLLALLPAYALLAYGLLWLARAVRGTTVAGFTRLPLLIVSQAGMAALVVASIVVWSDTTGCVICLAGSAWQPILALGVGLLFYATTDVVSRRLVAREATGIRQRAADALVKWHVARWAAVILLPVTVALAMLELDASDTVSGLVLMILALAYQGAGYALQRREGRRRGAWPFYATSYAVALLVTAMALPDTEGLYKVLFGDVVLLVVSAAIHRDYRWIYGAAWLLMLPVYLILYLYVPSLAYQGLLMGLLGLNYTVAGYALGRRSLFLGGPFLTAAAFLSVVAVGLTWGDPVLASLVLGVVAVLYLGAALWLSWPWLLLAPLLAVHLLIFSLNDLLVAGGRSLAWALTISYGVLGLVLLLGGLALRRMGRAQWGWTLYAVCALDLAGAYLAGLILGGPLAVGVSVVMAVLLFSFAWLERAQVAELKLPPLLTYLAIAVVFVGHFYVLHMAGIDFEEAWPPLTAALCALFVGLAWLLRSGPLAGLYGTPLRWAGLALMAIPAVGAVGLSVLEGGPGLVAATLTIAGLTCGVDGTLRRVRYLVWLTLGIVFVGHFFAMAVAGIEPDEVLWWAITAVLCGAFVAVAWLLRRGPMADLYAKPLRWAGLALMAIPVVCAVGLSVLDAGPVVAAVTLAIAGLTYGAEATLRRVRYLVWLTIGIVFVGHFFVMGVAGIGFDEVLCWPITAALCAAFVALGWLLRRGPTADLYAKPLRWAGLALMAVPLAGSVTIAASESEPVLIAVTFAIASLTFGADGALRRLLWLSYLGIGALVVVLWGVFLALELSEPQAYVFPVGLTLLGIGWNERRHGRSLQYQGCTVPGLALLMGTAFAQSLGRGNWPYALLLLAESLVVTGWGVRKHLKRCVQVGGLGLLANAIAQLGPAFVDLSGWIQLGLTGTILLGGGMLALLKREEILSARQRLTDEWRQWEP
jgi:hypothetical protein